MDVGELRDCTVGEFLHPGLEGVRALDLACRIAIENVLGFFNGGARFNLAGNLLLLADEPLELLDAPPGVGFFQVDFGANKRTRRQGIPLTAHASFSGATGEELVPKEVAQGTVRRTRGRCSGVEL